MYYNFARIHRTLRTTPDQAAGVTEKLWNIVQFAFNGFLSVAYQGRGKTEMPADTEQVRLGSPGSNRRRRSVPVTSCLVTGSTSNRRRVYRRAVYLTGTLTQ